MPKHLTKSELVMAFTKQHGWSDAYTELWIEEPNVLAIYSYASTDIMFYDYNKGGLLSTKPVAEVLGLQGENNETKKE